MRLPQEDALNVPIQKIVGYLLDLGHPVGRFKARVFRSVGYDESTADLLAKQISEIGKEGEVVKIVSSAHGRKYIVDGELNTPSGRVVKVRTVWIIEGEDRPRFVTAYPG